MKAAGSNTVTKAVVTGAGILGSGLVAGTTLKSESSSPTIEEAIERVRLRKEAASGFTKNETLAPSPHKDSEGLGYKSENVSSDLVYLEDKPEKSWSGTTVTLVPGKGDTGTAVPDGLSKHLPVASPAKEKSKPSKKPASVKVPFMRPNRVYLHPF